LALVASEPFHQWMHGDHGVAHSGHREIHDGSCEHQPEHRSDDDCLLCIKGHGHAIALQRCGATVGELAPTRNQRPAATPDALGDPLVGVLGARAPPVIG
jgi:hypothetical protein